MENEANALPVLDDILDETSAVSTPHVARFVFPPPPDPDPAPSARYALHSARLAAARHDVDLYVRDANDSTIDARDVRRSTILRLV